MRFFKKAAMALVLGVWLVSSGTVEAQPNVLGNVDKLLVRSDNKTGHTKYFFHDVFDSVQFFMERPERLSVYSVKTGRFVEGSAPANIASSPLCTTMTVSRKTIKMPLEDKLIKSYNSAKPGSAERRNFWVATAACLSGHEGAEAWMINNASKMKLNKIDVKVPEPKFVYGVFQVSTEKGTAMQAACEKSWKDFKALASPSKLPKEYLAGHASLVNLSDSTTSGRASTTGSMRALGDINKQRFNIYSGVHELFRAAASGGKCLNPFDRTQNRFGPLRTRSEPLIACINRMATRAMEKEDNVGALVDNMLFDSPPSMQAPSKAVMAKDHAK